MSLKFSFVLKSRIFFLTSTVFASFLSPFFSPLIRFLFLLLLLQPPSFPSLLTFPYVTSITLEGGDFCLFFKSQYLGFCCRSSYFPFVRASKGDRRVRRRRKNKTVRTFFVFYFSKFSPLKSSNAIEVSSKKNGRPRNGQKIMTLT